MEIKRYEFKGERIYGGHELKDETNVLKKMQKEISSKCDEMYIVGELKRVDKIAVAVVGSRKMTEYGRRVCWYMVPRIAAAGVTIVSGLMYGVDLEAHKAALSAGGRTIAVLGYGINYLPRYRYAYSTAQQIINGGQGAIISEYAPDEGPKEWTYPKRNRIVAALSCAVIIIEAGKKSGSLITAGESLDQGKMVFVVPGPIFSNVSAGKHDLIKSGATLIDEPDEVLSYLGITSPSKSKKLIKPANLNPIENQLFDILKLEALPLSVDELQEITNSSVSDINVALTSLELLGLIKRDRNAKWGM